MSKTLEKLLDRSCHLFIGGLVVLAGCGGDGGGSGGGSTPPPGPNAPQSTGVGWITIDTPVSDPTYITDADSIEVGGSAFISPRNSVCCSGSASRPVSETTTRIVGFTRRARGQKLSQRHHDVTWGQR